MRVYIEAASQAHERLNVLTEIMFLDALKKAQSLDAEFERTGKVTGLCESRATSPSAAIPSSDFCAVGALFCPLCPVHGVPVSLKDMLDVEGYDTTLGFTHKRNQPAAKDASLVSLIRKVRPTLLPLSLPHPGVPLCTLVLTFKNVSPTGWRHPLRQVDSASNDALVRVQHRAFRCIEQPVRPASYSGRFFWR